MISTLTQYHFNFDMVRPKRVKGRALKQRDWFRVPKKAKRPAPPPAAPPKKPTDMGGIDWELILFIGLGFAALILLIFWAYTNR